MEEATVRRVDEPCFYCGHKEKTVLMKVKKAKFQAIVCEKHFWQILDRTGKPDTEK